MTYFGITNVRNIRVAKHDDEIRRISLQIESESRTGARSIVTVDLWDLTPEITDKLLTAFADEDTIVPEAIKGAA